MNTLEINWENKTEVRAEVKEYVDYMSEAFKTDYLSYDEDADEEEAIHVMIDGSQYCIYTYYAKQIAWAFDIDVFGESEMTGERYRSYEHIAYEVLYNLYWNERNNK